MLKMHTVGAVLVIVALTATTTRGSSQAPADGRAPVSPSPSAASVEAPPADATACYGTVPENGMVGTALTRGNFRLDGSIIQESATIFIGARIGSGNAPVTIAFTSGVRFRLAPASEMIVAPDHMMIVSGSGELLEARGCEVRVRGLRVLSGPNTSNTRVVLLTQDVATVETLAGAVSVFDQTRGLIANLDAGGAVNFYAPESGPATAFVRGCLEERDNRLVLTDELTKRSAEVMATTTGVLRTTLDKEVGSRLDVAGYASSAGSPERPLIVRAAGLQRLGGCRGLLGALWPWPALAAATGTVAFTSIVSGPNAPPEGLPISP